jgi:hypothetical protein
MRYSSIKHRCLRAPGHLIEGEDNLAKNARRLGTTSIINRSRGGDPSLNIPEAVRSNLVKTPSKADVQPCKKRPRHERTSLIKLRAGDEYRQNNARGWWHTPKTKEPA